MRGKNVDLCGTPLKFPALRQPGQILIFKDISERAEKYRSFGRTMLQGKRKGLAPYEPAPSASYFL